ncbi:MAG TPA: TerC family protein [Flavobacteriales bacterium]|nr:TerC family protein [Flavobacteriales bacterium]
MFENLDYMWTSEGLTSFAVLTLLEIVLGIDNIVFLSIVVARAPREKQRSVRNWGLVMAMVMRVGMLFGINVIVQNQHTALLTVAGHAFSIKDIILLIGGLFLIGKSTMEIHHKIHEAAYGPHPGEKEKSPAKKVVNGLGMLFAQIAVINIIFSIDSILTAVGLTTHTGIMILAVIISTLFMMLFAKHVGEFINNNPTIIMLALSFLIMIGTLLIADAFHVEIPRGYVYFAMGFSLFVEMLNLLLLKNLYRKKEDLKDIKKE